MNDTKQPNSRRRFLVRFTVGTGVLVGALAGGINPMRRALFDNMEALIGDYANEDSILTWFEVTADNRIILHSPKVEMGQGAFTGLGQLVAEELEVEMDQIEVVHAVTLGRPIDPRSTGGSDTISGMWLTLRELAAKLREMMKANAATILGAPVASLSVKNGIISANGKSLTYGEIVQQATSWTEPEEVKLKEKKDFKVIGKAVPRIDLMPKILGDPIFGIDVSLPDMVYGLVLRPPTVDTVYVSSDISKAKSMPGVVKVVQEPDFVAVVAKSRPEAQMAARAIKVNWKVNKVWEQDEILAMTKVGAGKEYLIQKEGKAVEGEDLVEAEYSTAAGAHAQMEPNGSVVHIDGDQVIVYISTQVPGVTQKEVAETLGLEIEQVEVRPTYLGGGFGRRLHTPNAMQAARIAKAVGKPVHVYYSRQDEFQSAEFRPPTHHTLKGKIGADGLIESIEHNTSSADAAFGSPILPKIMETILGSDLGAWGGGRINYMKIPNIRVSAWRLQLPFSTTMWRAPGLMANTFVLESFMDELAHKAGKDPVEFRLAHLHDEGKELRLKNVIKAAAEKAGWGKSLPKGHALGLATCAEIGATIAEIAEVSIENGEIKVYKVTCALDVGLAINPDGIRAQVEGAIIQGFSACMYERMELEGGKIVPTIFGPYKIATLKEAPREIEVVILESGDRPAGVGEPPVGPIGAAIGNAVFAATGIRLRNLPLSDDFAANQG
ncbi:MAG: molybdopterin cofactor-binding domain-containing protein [Bacteroidota bacterium]